MKQLELKQKTQPQVYYYFNTVKRSTGVKKGTGKFINNQTDKK